MDNLTINLMSIIVTIFFVSFCIWIIRSAYKDRKHFISEIEHINSHYDKMAKKMEEYLFYREEYYKQHGTYLCPECVKNVMTIDYCNGKKFLKCLSCKIVEVDNVNEDMLEDGFGGYWSKWCGVCNQPTIEIVRPGKVQCGNCGE